MPIPLYWRHDLGINWMRGELVTIAQLEDASAKSSGQRLPNDLLPSLAPGDVVLLKEGRFWIEPEWKIKPLNEPNRLGSKLSQDGLGIV
jgi:hypothetical protein